MRTTHNLFHQFPRLPVRRLVAGLALFGAVAAQAQWQWVDKDGRKVFSDRPPPSDVLEKNILKRPPGRLAPQAAAAGAVDAVAGAPLAAASAATDPPAKTAQAQVANVPKLSSTDRELEEKKKKAADAELAKRKAEEERVAKVKADNCARAKQGKAALDSGVRLGTTNAKGEREVMDDAARAAEVKRMQTAMATECPPSG